MGQGVLISLEGISKVYQDKVVVQDLSFTIHAGEFFTILGPSGCGKSTILKLISGLEHPEEGRLILDQEDITHLAAEKRPINTVFQSYALFPHMTVADNVAFGLKVKGVPKQEIKSRVLEALDIVRLSHLASRKPAELSGGQQQRVAIARAVVNRPKLLLLDESLSALDYKLRQEMQIELKQLQRKLGITFVYVTHDQEEALSMSDRILLMREGQIQQIGSPREIYETPNSLFSAGFIGEMNQFDGVILERKQARIYIAELMGQQCQIESTHDFAVGDQIHVLLRPEDLRLQEVPDTTKETGFVGHITERNYKGKTLDSVITLENGNQLLASEFFNEDDPDFDYAIDQKVSIDWVHGWEVVLPYEG
ncbi:spermidine/putrescine ABC transporter ATP-binding protein PotA [Algicola sagamiensis]|uniref:spermidine/putrescine ABC transporter ATP-binding protein PotA n=1 Tax=Algicola sagamiensis TaxID=163869 RepID=UPI00035E3EF6|nr:spermidine/putrescine ABC transporter ATP-binding protein PotA [Algicola sagamiensis]